MINLITDLIQSFSIIILTIMTFLLVRRVSRLDKRGDSQKFIKDYQVSRQLEDQPVCGCGHHQCFHDENGCGKTDSSSYFYPTLNHPEPLPPVSCGCKRYTGPEHLPMVIP